MSEGHASTVEYLLGADIRQRFEVAYNPGLDGDGWLAVSIDNVRTYPDSVKWVRVDVAERDGDLIVVTVDGARFAAFPGYPIVVREAQP